VSWPQAAGHPVAWSRAPIGRSVLPEMRAFGENGADPVLDEVKSARRAPCQSKLLGACWGVAVLSGASPGAGTATRLHCPGVA